MLVLQSSESVGVEGGQPIIRTGQSNGTFETILQLRGHPPTQLLQHVLFALWTKCLLKATRYIHCKVKFLNAADLRKM